MASSFGADEETLEESYRVLMPVDPAVGEGMLREIKEVMDRLGVVFFLRHGTCLGAIRDNGFIPWDDDLDVGSVIGLHGLTEESVDRIVEQAASAFRENGYFVKLERSDYQVSLVMMKSSTRTDWVCYRIVDDSIFQYPGVRIPVRLFADLREIDFAGDKHLVPNPPEEYLRFKYGEDWMTPKKTGYEQDIVQMIPDASVPGQGGGLRQLLTRYFLRRRAGKIRVLDHQDRPVSGAEVVVAGLRRFKTNAQGYAKLYVTYEDFYAVVIRYDGQEEVLYQEKLTPGGSYVYRPDPSISSGRLWVLALE